MPDGTRLAGLGGVFRASVWYPKGSETSEGRPLFASPREHARSTPRQTRWRQGPARKHWSTIYPEEVERLRHLRADVLVTHEAPGYHHNGFPLLDELARSVGAKVLVHGHHHDRLDSSGRWLAQGFQSFGVGLRGITAIDIEGNATVLLPGELDGQRSYREQQLRVP